MCIFCVLHLFEDVLNELAQIHHHGKVTLDPHGHNNVSSPDEMITPRLTLQKESTTYKRIISDSTTTSLEHQRQESIARNLKAMGNGGMTANERREGSARAHWLKYRPLTPKHTIVTPIDSPVLRIIPQNAPAVPTQEMPLDHTGSHVVKKKQKVNPTSFYMIELDRNI